MKLIILIVVALLVVLLVRGEVRDNCHYKTWVFGVYEACS